MTPRPRPPDEVAQALEAWVAFLSPSPTVLAQSRQGAQAAAERLCQPKLAPIWDHLTRRVTSSRRGNQIRNLLQAECENAEALDMSPKLRAYRDHARQKSIATRELRERKEALQQALAEAKAEREMRMRECAQLTSRVASTASQNSTAKAAIDEKQQHACIIRAQRRDVAQDIQIVRKYSRMFKHFSSANGRGDERQHTSLHVHAVKVKEMCLLLEQELARSERNSHEERSAAHEKFHFSGPPDHLWKALVMQMEEVLKQQTTARPPIVPLGWPAYWGKELRRHLECAAAHHVSRHQETQKLLAAAKRNESQFAELLQKMEPEPGKDYSSNTVLQSQCNHRAHKALGEINQQAICDAQRRLAELDAKWAQTLENDAALRQLNGGLMSEYVKAKLHPRAMAVQRAADSFVGKLSIQHDAFRAAAAPLQFLAKNVDSGRHARRHPTLPSSSSSTSAAYHQAADAPVVVVDKYKSPEELVVVAAGLRDAAMWDPVMHRFGQDMDEYRQSRLADLLWAIQAGGSAKDAADAALADTVASLRDRLAFVREAYVAEDLPRCEAILGIAGECWDWHETIARAENARSQFQTKLLK
ncbi:hypothetical protein HDU87_006620 [Geranomyces variabilis]|uniref:Uncharacterized protein n=1 Tax=Geranomyces variabilis TaxID=109894 RepID=A0AAD5TGR2_9FUNG|nr:hypothetical protein HDU87_006620 [Geranomyces variabilis]